MAQSKTPDRPTRGKKATFVCTRSSCYKFVKSYKDLKKHPNLETLFCQPCSREHDLAADLSKYRNGVDRAGKDNYCRWCLNGGNLLLCSDDRCQHGFCEECVELNLGKGAVAATKKLKNWYCFICDRTQLSEIQTLTKEAFRALAPKVPTKPSTAMKAPKTPTRAKPSSTPARLTSKSAEPLSRLAQSPEPMSTLAQSPKPLPTLAQSPEPLSTPAQSPEPLSTPAQSPEPLSTPAQSPEPMSTPAQSPEPLSTPAQSPEPLSTPAQSPEPMSTLAQSPGPLSTLAQSPGPLSTPAQSPEPMSTLAQSPEPKITVLQTKQPQQQILQRLPSPLVSRPKAQPYPMRPTSPIKRKLVSEDGEPKKYPRNFRIFSTSKLFPETNLPKVPLTEEDLQRTIEGAERIPDESFKELEKELYISDDESSNGPEDYFVALDSFVNGYDTPMEVDQTEKGNEIISWAVRDAEMLNKRLKVLIDALSGSHESFDGSKFRSDPQRLKSWISNVECFLGSAPLIVDRCKNINNILAAADE